MIKLKCFDGYQLREMNVDTVDKLKWLIYDLREGFKKLNLTDELDRDHMYKEYCVGLDHILDTILECHLKEDFRCTKCAPEEHEHEFCRCESRNIRIAKRNREMLKDNKAEPQQGTVND